MRRRVIFMDRTVLLLLYFRCIALFNANNSTVHEGKLSTHLSDNQSEKWFQSKQKNLKDICVNV